MAAWHWGTDSSVVEQSPLRTGRNPIVCWPSFRVGLPGRWLYIFILDLKAIGINQSSHIQLYHYIIFDGLKYSNSGMSKLLETLTVTRRMVVVYLHCSYELLISKRNGFVTFWTRVTESLLIDNSCVMWRCNLVDVFTSLHQAVTCLANCMVSHSLKRV